MRKNSGHSGEERKGAAAQDYAVSETDEFVSCDDSEKRIESKVALQRMELDIAAINV